jgi:hypothetical protein
LDAERVGNRVFYRIVSPEVRRYLTALRKCCV